MPIRSIQMLFLGLLVTMGLGASSCVYSTPYGHGTVVEGGVIYSDDRRPGTEVREYYYYPRSDVYYDPGVRVYYWREGGNWYQGRRLPRAYHIREHERYHFRSDVREPYRIHDRIYRDWENRRGDRDRDQDRGRYDRDRDRYDRDRDDRDRDRRWDRDRDRR